MILFWIKIWLLKQKHTPTQFLHLVNLIIFIIIKIQCILEISLFLLNTCMNSGLCQTSTSGTYTCQCAPGFSGLVCEIAGNILLNMSELSQSFRRVKKIESKAELAFCTLVTLHLTPSDEWYDIVLKMLHQVLN